METITLITASGSKAFFPLLLPLLKVLGLSAKQHLGKKIITESAKDAAKDKIKETIRNKKKTGEWT